MLLNIALIMFNVSDDLPAFCVHAALLVRLVIWSSTAQTYNSAQKRYLAFCDQVKYNLLMCTEELILLFVSYLDGQGLQGPLCPHLPNYQQSTDYIIRLLVVSVPAPKAGTSTTSDQQTSTTTKPVITSDILVRM